MSFVETQVPKQSRPSSAGVSKFTDEELDSVLEMLEAGKSVSDDVVYSEMVGKRQPRDVAYYLGHSLRNAILDTGKYTAKELRVRTWADSEVEDGYRWALQQR